MNAPVIARIFGILFLLAGIAGFLPWVAPDAPLDARVVTWDTYYRMLFGIFPVNVAHDALHLLFGVWGLAAAARFKAAVVYCRVVAWVYLVLVVFGVVPILNTLMGIAPVYGWDVGLHAIVALLAAYGGYGRGSLQEEQAAA
jgi:hypothetical protein